MSHDNETLGLEQLCRKLNLLVKLCIKVVCGSLPVTGSNPIAISDITVGPLSKVFNPSSSRDTLILSYHLHLYFTLDKNIH